ncbi:MAG: hypothetical protein V4685_17505 [Bacteroidota bacterium]
MFIPNIFQLRRMFFPAVFISVLFFSVNNVNAQIGIGTNNPNPSAELDVYSNTRGLLLPRMSTPQRKAIVNPAIGLLVFDTDKNSLYLYDGAKWTAVGSFTDKDLPPFTRELTQSQVNDHLGFSVAMDSNYAFIGAPLDSINGTGRQGAVYVMKKDTTTGWQFHAKLTASDVAAGDYFGYSVSIKDDYAVVGTYNATTTGAAYIFMRTGNTWAQQAKLTAIDGAGGDLFGAAVSIYGDYVLVGAPKDDESGIIDCGSAYMFSRTGTAWAQQEKFVAVDKTSFDGFGTVVVLNGDKLVIAAPTDTVGSDPFSNLFLGSAYPYKKNGNTWLPLRKLRSPTRNLVDGLLNLGKAASIDGNYAVIGEGGVGGNRAQTYICADSGWIFQSTLTVPPGITSRYGTSVCLSGDYLAIGGTTILPFTTCCYPGRVFCYQRTGNTWTLIKTIDKIDASTNGYTLGRAVAIDGNSLDVLIGSPGNSSGSEINQNLSVKGAFYFTNLQ